MYTKECVDISGVSDVISNAAANIRYIYTTYVIGYEQSMKTLSYTTAHSRDFAKFLDEQKSHPVHGFLSLPAFLIMPVQRLAKYELLLRELLKYTPATQLGRDRLVHALEVMKEATTFVNEHQRNAENVAKIADIQEHVIGYPPELFNTKRHYITESIMKCRIRRRIGIPKKERVLNVVLFSDFVMLCSQAKQGRPMKCKLHIPLPEVMVDFGKSQDLEIKFISPTVMFTLVADTPGNFSLWQTYLNAHTKTKPNKPN